MKNLAGAFGGADPVVRAGRPRPASCKARTGRRGRRPRTRGSAPPVLVVVFDPVFLLSKQPLRRRRALLVRRNQLVPPFVGVGVDLLARRVGVEPGQGAPNARRERHGGAIARNRSEEHTSE